MNLHFNEVLLKETSLARTIGEAKCYGDALETLQSMGATSPSSFLLQTVADLTCVSCHAKFHSCRLFTPKIRKIQLTIQ